MVWRAGKVAAGLTVAGYFAWLAFGHLDWAETWHAIRVAQPLWILAGAAVIVVDYFLRIVRWWLIVRCLAPGISIRQCAGPFLASVATENLLGFRSGDVLRTVGFQRQLGISPSQVLSTIVVEHLAGFFTLLMLFLAALHGLGSETPLGSLVHNTLWAVALAFLSLFLIVLKPSWFEKQMRLLSLRSSGLAWGVPARILNWMARVFESFSTINSPRTLIGISVVSLFVWFLEGAAFGMAARSLAIANAGLGPWLALAAGTLAMLIPGGPGGIGTFDYFAISGMMTYGVARGEATVFALLAHALIWLPPTLAGLVWLLVSFKKSASLRTMPPDSVPGR